MFSRTSNDNQHAATRDLSAYNTTDEKEFIGKPDSETYCGNQEIYHFMHHRLAERKEQGYYRTLAPRHTSEHIDFSSNDYLGLHHHQYVRECSVHAVEQWGTSSTGSRLVSGNIALLEQLESYLATFCGWESCLVFSSGYLANLSVITSMTDNNSVIFSDSLSHASLIDGCRMSRAQIHIFPHRDYEHLADLLQRYRQQNASTVDTIPPLVITESVYSTDGAQASLEVLYQICQQYGAILIVDEAHGIGVVGHTGRGLAHLCGLANKPGVIVTGTLSKSCAAQGGFVLGQSIVRDFLINTGRSFIFDTGLNPAAAGAACGALQVMQEQPQLFTSLSKNSTTVLHKLEKNGIAYSLPRTMQTHSPAIIALPIANPHAAVYIQTQLRKKNIYVGCFRPPSVPEHKTMLRLTVKAHHDEAIIDMFINELTQLYHVYDDRSMDSL